MSRVHNPILVTGSHRSGTTWVGRMLSVDRRVAYIQEPFNYDHRISECEEPVEYAYQFVHPGIETKYYDRVARFIGFKYPILANLKKVNRVYDLEVILRRSLESLRSRANNCRPLVKDPLALFSAEWMSRAFDMDVLVMVRHPAAFCSSLKLKDWRFTFSEFLAQEELMEAHLWPFRDAIAEYAREEKDIISQSILLWNCIHSMIHAFREKHDEWIFLRHEDVSMAPVEEFEAVYGRLHLEFTDECRRAIEESSGAHNPVEQQEGNPFVRDSKANITNWKSRLTPGEIGAIRKGTEGYSELFYSDDEW